VTRTQPRRSQASADFLLMHPSGLGFWSRPHLSKDLVGLQFRPDDPVQLVIVVTPRT